MKKANKSKFKFGKGTGVGVTFMTLAIVIIVGFQNGSMTDLQGAPLNGDEQRLSQITPFAGDEKIEQGALELDPYTNQCGADKAWIGHEVDEGAIKATGNPYRILPPGSMVTMDHRPIRINIDLDENGVVRAVRCG
jgi:hypothetical protein